MFEWSEKFETHIEIVDTQHKKLVALINQLCQGIETHSLSEDVINTIFMELVEYAEKHFSDEEQLMLEIQVSEKHTSLHKMEHHSFIYDIERMRNYFSPDTDIIESGERLLQFIIAWLTYHILGMDQMMAAQIHDIKQGISPDKSYELHKKGECDITTTRLLFNAVLKMWKQCNEHCHQLERELASLKGFQNKD
jgi:hemerythrin